MTQTLKFFYNGIKVNGGKLQKASYSAGGFRSHPEGTIAVYAREYTRFTGEIAEQFQVINETDSQTDYFETDRFYVFPSHPLYSQIKAATEALEAHYAKHRAKREAKYAARLEARKAQALALFTQKAA